MPYDSGSGTYIRRATTVLDETPDGDTVNSAVATKLDTSTDDAVTDLNHHNINGGHYPATSVNTDSRYLKQSPAGMVSWASGVPIDQAALKDLSNVTAGITANINISGNAATATDLATGSVLDIAKGGTGANTAAGARANLGSAAATDLTAHTIDGAAHASLFAVKMGLANFLHVRDEKAGGTAGGSSSATTWHTRDLNTVKTNNISGASVASNRITLPAGTFLVQARAPSYIANRTRLQLFNFTASSTILVGGNAYANSTSSGYVDSSLFGTFTLSSASVLELRHYIQNGTTSDGLGVATSVATEVYAEVMIWKLG